MITNYEKICVICGAPATEVHHLVFGRGMRPLADADGLTAPLCQKCHKDIHYHGTAAALSKIVGQMQFEATCGKENPREVFRERYGRSYL